ncbi:MAG: hypothetical protein H6765_09200 [Candidatus Peribacteria bacterium]|nr:MAG: hypothetical protein H6765_09200 [Candidatus Peribacteria bacterium]
MGTDKEDASTRLYNAITSNQVQAPLGIQTRDIQAIDPDHIPIFSFAVYYDPELAAAPEPDTRNIQLQLRTIALDLVDKLKTVDNTTLRYHQ